MTNQERINQAAERIDEALHSACMPPSIIRETMAWVWEASFAILAGAARMRAMTVLCELVMEGYTPELMNAYIRECVDLRQHDELKQKEKACTAYLDRVLDTRKFEELVQLLAEQFGDEEPEEGEASDEDLESLMEEYPVHVDFNSGLQAYADPYGDDPEPEEDDDLEADAPLIDMGTVDSVPEIGKARVADEP